MRFLYVQLKGGLGNQLFIYAFAKALAERQRRGVVLDVDAGFVKDKLYRRSYELDNFGISPDGFVERSKGVFASRILKRLFVLVNMIMPRQLMFYVSEPNLKFDGRWLTAGRWQKYLYVDGYWQSESYFTHISEELSVELLDGLECSLDNIPDALEGISQSNSVSVHVRKFVESQSEFMNNLSVDYYKRAFRHIEDRVVEPTYYVFSEAGIIGTELEEFFKSKNCIFISDNLSNSSAIYDFRLMTMCCNHIIANSSFSWWAAWLSEKRYGRSVVVAPDVVINEGPSQWGFPGLLPDRWIRCGSLDNEL